MKLTNLILATLCVFLFTKTYSQGHPPLNSVKTVNIALEKGDFIPVEKSDTIIKYILKLEAADSISQIQLYRQDSLYRLLNREFTSLENKFVRYTYHNNARIDTLEAVIQVKDQIIKVNEQIIGDLRIELTKATASTKLKKIWDWGYGPFRVKYITAAAAGYFGYRGAEHVANLLRDR